MIVRAQISIAQQHEPAVGFVLGQGRLTVGLRRGELAYPFEVAPLLLVRERDTGQRAFVPGVLTRGDVLDPGLQ